MYQWCGFKSRRGKNKNLTALKFNFKTVWFNYIRRIYICSKGKYKIQIKKPVYICMQQARFFLPIGCRMCRAEINVQFSMFTDDSHILN